MIMNYYTLLKKTTNGSYVINSTFKLWLINWIHSRKWMYNENIQSLIGNIDFSHGKYENIWTFDMSFNSTHLNNRSQGFLFLHKFIVNCELPHTLLFCIFIFLDIICNKWFSMAVLKIVNLKMNDTVEESLQIENCLVTLSYLQAFLQLNFQRIEKTAHRRIHIFT